MTQPNYFDSLNYPGILDAYPTGAAFLDTYRGMSRDELHARQDAQFRKVLKFAWQVPFYQRLWGDKGIEAGDIGSLADIAKLPTYSKSDLMASVEAHPPIGDFHGLDSYAQDERPCLIFQTTSGTTGRPQPLLFGPKSREVQSLLLGRLYALQGLNRRDVIHSVYGHGMVNGGHYVRETINHWVGAQLLTAGTGIETRSANQVALMQAFQVTAIVGFGDFIKRLSEVAREEGLEPGVDIPVRIISGHMGAESRESMSEAWGGAEVFDWYGVGDTGCIAGEGPDQTGLHIMEDAQYLELLDVDTGQPVETDGMGDMVCTCLFKDDVFPIIRFQTHDVSREVAGENPLGLPFRRLEGFLGRSDNMVKLRGINIYPQGIGALISAAFPVATGEYICRVTRLSGRDEMTVSVEVTETDGSLRDSIEAHLRTRLGVGIAVELVAPGETAAESGIETRQKPIRLIDER
ncbi:phenylacetate--CoA ligase family protein [Hoeflea sp.]|uniref:phenylacetate--CoA ligase family protein n=1 Tax=Hoeflea sp. TaxID=1940281 RepID=UPI003B01C648